MSEAATEVATNAAPADAAAQPATPAPDASAANGTQPGTDGTQTPDAKPDKPPRVFTQDELDRIVDKARRKESRRAEALALERYRREAAERELAELRGQPRGGESSGRAPGEKPRQEDFKDYDSYVEALADWKVEQRIKATQEAGRRASEERNAAEYARAVQEHMAAGVEKYADFEEVIGARGVAFTDHMVDALIDLEDGYDIAYQLAQHPKETQRIAALSKAAQIREIDKFAASLKKPPAPTSAPDPIKPGKAEGAAVKTLESTANNYSDWLKLRNRQLGRG